MYGQNAQTEPIVIILDAFCWCCKW